MSLTCAAAPSAAARASGRRSPRRSRRLSKQSSAQSSDAFETVATPVETATVEDTAKSSRVEEGGKDFKPATADARKLKSGGSAPSTSPGRLGGKAHLNGVAAVILGGGVSNPTTYPLTQERCKPAVPIGASYRLIDVPISNCINSGVKQVYVLTQFNSLSLNRHLSRAYPPRLFGIGSMSLSLDVLATSQTPNNSGWTTGSADAVRCHLDQLGQSDRPHERTTEYVILAGEHLYRMDYSTLVAEHRQTGADITVSCVPVAQDNPALLGADGAGLGLVRLADDRRILEFVEKPESERIEAMVAEAREGGCRHTGKPEKPLIGSMGVYVFKASVLEKLLRDDPGLTDFGSDVLPAAVEMDLRVYANVFHNYWRDISTLRTYLECNLELAKRTAEFQLHDRDNPLFGLAQQLMPPTMTRGTNKLDTVLVGDGCDIADSVVRNSVLGNGSVVRPGCDIEGTYMMGADLDSESTSGARGSPRAAEVSRSGHHADVDARAVFSAKAAGASGIPVGLGERCVIKRAIIDRNARIGADCRLTNEAGVVDTGPQPGLDWVIQSGIIVVKRNGIIPAGTVV